MKNPSRTILDGIAEFHADHKAKARDIDDAFCLLNAIEDVLQAEEDAQFCAECNHQFDDDEQLRCRACDSARDEPLYAIEVEGPQHSADLAKAVSNIWDVLHAYQDDSIPFHKYESGFQLQDDDPMRQTMIDTYEAYRAEWDAICEDMATIIEALGLTQEEVS